MSRRTAEASKAIRQAWQKERERVLLGKGTRDWTPEQQQDIIDKGKAYDADGKSFEGQHMKSAEKYPEYQGDPDNIQFLTKKEHLDAHRGNWQNPTNWYYDPVTYEFTDFGDGKYISCMVIDLSHPIITIIVDTEMTSKKEREALFPAEENKKIASPKLAVETVAYKESVVSLKESNQSLPPPAATTKPKTSEWKNREKGVLGKAKNAIVSGSKKVVKWYSENKELIDKAVAIGAAIGATIGVAAKAIGGTTKSSSDSEWTDDQDSFATSSDDFDELDAEETVDEPLTVEDNDDIENETAEKSYTPNDVPAGRQRYHYKDGSVKVREKGPYSRGKKKKYDE